MAQNLNRIYPCPGSPNASGLPTLHPLRNLRRIPLDMGSEMDNGNGSSKILIHPVSGRVADLHKVLIGSCSEGSSGDDPQLA